LEANQRSVRILRGLGMAEAGLGGHDLFLDQPSRYRRFSIAAEDWPGSRAS
jgi:RimJ/RimL family protein N-acetyltransferase